MSLFDPNKVDTYEMTLEIVRPGVRSMQQLATLIGEALEASGVSPDDYNLIVKGPPELRISVVQRP